MAIKPAKLLRVYCNIGAVAAGDNPAWQATLTVTPQPHSSSEFGSSGFYDGTHVNPGDWVATSNSGQALRIRDISAKTQTVVTCVVEDVDGFNGLVDPNQEGNGAIQSGSGVLFEEQNGMPVLFPLPDALPGGFTPTFAQQLINRFFVANGGFATPASAVKLEEPIAGLNATTAAEALVELNTKKASNSISLAGITATTVPAALTELNTKIGANYDSLNAGKASNTVSISGVTATTVAAALSELHTKKIAVSQMGVANGVATLDSTGKVPAAQLPSYVDNVIEVSTKTALPATGTAGTIYITLDTGKTYRWSGTAYLELTASPGSTDAVPEGSVNLYFTDARARAAVTSVTGNAGTATKLTTARTITVSGDATGSVSFDGSANVTLNLDVTSIDGGTY